MVRNLNLILVIVRDLSLFSYIKDKEKHPKLLPNAMKPVNGKVKIT